MKKNNDLFKEIIIEKQYWKSYKNFLYIYKENKLLTSWVFIISILISILIISFPFLTKYLSIATDNKALDLFITISIIITLLSIIRIILDFSINLLCKNANINMEIKWRTKLLKKTHKLPMTFFDNRTVGSFLSRINNDLKDLINNAFQFLSNLIIVVLVLSGGFIFIFVVSWIVGTIILSFLVIVSIIYCSLLKKYIVTGQYVKVLNAQITWSTDENIRMIKDIKINNMSNAFQEKFYKLQNNYYFGIKKLNIRLSFYRLLAYSINTLITSLALIILSEFKINFELEDWKFIGLIMATNLLTIPLIDFGNLFIDIVKTTASLTRLYDWMNQNEEINEGTLKPNLIGKIEFKNVSFSYITRNNKEVKVFENFWFKIKPNQVTQLWGDSSSGKSTFFKLILRLYEPQEGDIFIDGIPIKKIELSHLRNQISYISSSHYFLPTFISEKLQNDKFFKELLIKFKLEKVYNQLLETNFILNSQGMQLSDSEKQMLLIVKMIYDDKKIILLDSFDCYLDRKQIKMISEYINKNKRDKTIILIGKKEHNYINIQENKEFINDSNILV